MIKKYRVLQPVLVPDPRTAGAKHQEGTVEAFYFAKLDAISPYPSVQKQPGDEVQFDDSNDLDQQNVARLLELGAIEEIEQ